MSREQQGSQPASEKPGESCRRAQGAFPKTGYYYAHERFDVHMF